MVPILTLCPTCNNTLDRKPNEFLGEDILKCRVCRRFSLEGLAVWLETVNLIHLKKLARQRDDDNARHQLMMESPIEHPIWTRIYL